MIQTRSIVAGVLLGLAIVSLCLVFILAKDWLWSLFELGYGLLGIQGTRTHLWQMFTTTIGLGVAAFGAFVLWAVIMRVRNEPHA
jgi:hypothetical protein